MRKVIFGFGGAGRFSVCSVLACGVTAMVVPAQLSAQLPPPPRNQFTDNNGVDVRTGNQSFSVPMLHIGPPGQFGLDLTYSASGGNLRDSFDNGYRSIWLGSGYHSVNASFGESGGGISPQFSTPESIIDESSTHPRFQRQDGSIVYFGNLVLHQLNSMGDGSEDTYRLADSVVFADGVRWTLNYKTYSRPTAPDYRLQSVTSNTGYQIKFIYASNTPGALGWLQRTGAVGINMAVEYCDPIADTCSLQQQWPTATDAQVGTNERQMTNSAGEVTKLRGLGTDGSGNQISSITLPGWPLDGIEYYEAYMPTCSPVVDEWAQCNMGGDYRVVKIVTPSRTTTYSYNYSQLFFTTITSTNPNNVQAVHESNGPGVLGMKRVTDTLNRTTAFVFDVNGLIKKSTWPEADRTEWIYDGNANPTSETAFPKTGAGSLSMAYTYESCAIGVPTCGKVRTATDPRSNTAEFRYNSRGQKIAEIGPPDANGVRAVQRWFYEDRYAYVKDASGTMVAASNPVSVLVKEVKCRATFNGDMNNPACASAADEVTTVYEYGASGSSNALLVRAKIEDQGAGRLNLRTCYGYDRFGNKISETSPRAGLSTCSS